MNLNDNYYKNASSLHQGKGQKSVLLLMEFIALVPDLSKSCSYYCFVILILPRILSVLFVTLY